MNVWSYTLFQRLLQRRAQGIPALAGLGGKQQERSRPEALPQGLHSRILLRGFELVGLVGKDQVRIPTFGEGQHVQVVLLGLVAGVHEDDYQPQGLISGAINAQMQDNTTPFTYRPVTLDEMHQTPPATGVVPVQGQGIVATPQPQASAAVPFQAQTQSVTPQRTMSEDERFLRAAKHLHLQDPTNIIKMALEKRLNNDAAFQHGQRVREAVGDYPVNGNANEQMAFFAKNLPLYGDQGQNLVKAFDTAHPGYQMNVVDNGDRKDVVTLDKFSGGVQNPLTMKQGLNPDKQAANAARMQAAALSAAASRYGADQRAASQNLKTVAMLSKDQAKALVTEAVAKGKLSPDKAVAFEEELKSDEYSGVPEAMLRRKLGL